MKIVAEYPESAHLIEGKKLDPNGTGLVPQPSPLDFANPMDFAVPGNGVFTSLPDSEIQQANMTQALGMQSGDGKLNQVAIDMTAASDCHDEPTKGGIAYGPRFTGDNDGESYG